jgi:protein-disulfide isomerase
LLKDGVRDALFATTHISYRPTTVGMTPRFTRRQAWQLGAVLLGGFVVGRAAHWFTPVGRDIGRSDTVAAILDGTESPESGPNDATLSLAVFSDYRCPACRAAFPALEAALRGDGKVRVIYKDWPIFGAASERAAQVALASAAQGIYPAVHRALMMDDRKIDDVMLQDVVTGAGGDWMRVTRDLARDGTAMMNRLRENGREALSIGLTGTPGYLAGPILQLGALDSAGFARLFARARAEP